MAKFKKSTSKKNASSRKPDLQAQAERFSKTLRESAEQIRQAGVGALGRAQAEGGKLFEGLVKEGMNLEQTARKLAGGRADVVRDAVESRVEQARGRATDTWDRLEKVFEDRVQRALTQLGVPGRDDLSELSRRVESLTAELRRQHAAAPRSTASTRAPARKAAKSAANRATAGKATAKKATAKKTAKPATKAAKKSVAAKTAPANATRKAATSTGRKATRARKSASIAKPVTPVAPKA